MGLHDRPHTVRTVFANATDGFSAADEFRARGFKIDLATSIAGDLIVSIQAGRTRADEVGALVAAHDGRIEGPIGRLGPVQPVGMDCHEPPPNGPPVQ
jgi:hypothetical protein